MALKVGKRPFGKFRSEAAIESLVLAERRTYVQTGSEDICQLLQRTQRSWIPFEEYQEQGDEALAREFVVFRAPLRSFVAVR
jgi:hypothetical protein